MFSFRTLTDLKNIKFQKLGNSQKIRVIDNQNFGKTFVSISDFDGFIEISPHNVTAKNIDKPYPALFDDPQWNHSVAARTFQWFLLPPFRCDSH